MLQPYFGQQALFIFVGVACLSLSPAKEDNSPLPSTSSSQEITPGVSTDSAEKGSGREEIALAE